MHFLYTIHTHFDKWTFNLDEIGFNCYKDGDRKTENGE
jgi:hypothetical protein